MSGRAGSRHQLKRSRRGHSNIPRYCTGPPAHSRGPSPRASAPASAPSSPPPSALAPTATASPKELVVPPPLGPRPTSANRQRRAAPLGNIGGRTTAWAPSPVQRPVGVYDVSFGATAPRPRARDAPSLRKRRTLERMRPATARTLRGAASQIATAETALRRSRSRRQRVAAGGVVQDAGEPRADAAPPSRRASACRRSSRSAGPGRSRRGSRRRPRSGRSRACPARPPSRRAASGSGT